MSSRRSGRFATLRTAVWLCAVAGMTTGCITVGEDFRVEPVSQLEIGTTTRQDVRDLFGDPWRVGVEDGDPTWTYAHYRYSAFGAEHTKDLVIRFDASGKVRSYTFNSTDPADAGRAAP